MDRRTLIGATAVAAAAAGAGLWWGLRQSAGAPGTPPAAGSGDAVPADFWQQRFTRPEGGELAMAEWRGRPLVVNFWATWCPPCIRELPELDRFSRDGARHGWQMIGLAVDGPTPVREFLRKLPVSFPVGLAGLQGTELSRLLGNSGGALPFTVLIDAGGRIVQRKLGQTSHDELLRWTGAGG